MCAALLRRVVLERVSESTTKFSKSALSKIMFKQARARATYQAACAHVSARRLETSHTATLKQLSQTSSKICEGPSDARIPGLRSVKQEFTHLLKAASLCWKDEHWDEIQEVQQRFTHAIDEVECVGVAATLAGYEEFCVKHRDCREHCRGNQLSHIPSNWVLTLDDAKDRRVPCLRRGGEDKRVGERPRARLAVEDDRNL